MYLQDEILPMFKKWIDSMKSPVSMKDAKKYGRYFLANHVDPEKAETRGAIYDLFEDVYEYADMKKIMHAGQLDKNEVMNCDNMGTVARGIVWSIEHDGFDSVKYDPITAYGMDINAMHGQTV